MILKLNKVCIGKRTFVCRYTPFSPNKKMHWGTKYKWTTAWKEEVKWAVYQCKNRPRKPLEYTKVNIILHTIKLQDKDNAYASVKAIVDGLTEAEVIKDDSTEHIDLTVSQNKVAHVNEQYVEIIT